MASVREIRRRIRSVRNIAQVTRAMEMVAASRMRRAQEQALASRPYAAKAWEVLIHLVAMVGSDKHPLLSESTKTGTVAVVLITGDRGLAGAYNGNVMRNTQRFIHVSFGARFLKTLCIALYISKFQRIGSDFWNINELITILIK